MTHLNVKRLVFVASIASLVAVALMVLSLVAPQPIFIVLAMSLGQLFGTLSFAAYLLAIALDLQGGGGRRDDAVERRRQRQEESGPA